jgi:hypothetical protein
MLQKYIPLLKAKVVFQERGDFSIKLFEVEDAAQLLEGRRIPHFDIWTCGMKPVAFYIIRRPN